MAKTTRKKKKTQAVIKWNYPFSPTQPLPQSTQYVLPTTMLRVNGAGSAWALQLIVGSGTGWRQSYGWRISRDKLRAAPWSEGLPQQSINIRWIHCHMVINKTSTVSMCQLLTVQLVGFMKCI